jgi:hypothetical protein
MRFIQSEHIKVANLESRLDDANKVIDDYISDTGIDSKKALRLRLLSEEVLRLAKSIIGHGIMEFWLEGDARLTRIYLTAENNIDRYKQDELLSVSKTGENSAEKGFFGKLLAMFIMDVPGESTWNLRDYKDEIRRRKREDPYSQEAWDDLERSLVANLADDIEVGISRDKIKMVVTKDFSEALSTIGSRVPEYKGDYTFIDSNKLDESTLYDKADELIEDLEVSKKDAIHLKLLFEETVGMLKSMAADYHAEIWFEKYKKECCLKLTGKTLMDSAKKKELISISSDHDNHSAKGFMGKVTDVIESGLLNYTDVMKLQQQYGAGYVSYGSMGLYGFTEGSVTPGIQWSLCDYRDSLEADQDNNPSVKEAWDELEKSIVASLAKDVLVGVKGDRIDITMVYELND